MKNLLNEFIEVRECIYKDEHYSVRDNGAVMRHPREAMRKRKLDNVWSFGTPNLYTGYLYFGGERVHRIVASAYHGSAPSNQYVVDHIDTNRQNNRPDNLRWLTKLENILNNEITRKKVELICGSIEAFLNNPSLLYGHETEDQNFSWMRNVTKEEAQISLARLTEWAKSSTKPNGGSLGDWLFQEYPHNDGHKTEDQNYSLMRDVMKEEAIIKLARLTEMIKNTTKPNGGSLEICSFQDSPNLNNDTKLEEPTVLYQESNSLSESHRVELGLYTNAKDHLTYNSIKEKKEKPNALLETQSLTPNAIQLNWKYPVQFLCCPRQFSGNPLETYMANLEEGKNFCSNDKIESTVLRYGMPQPDCLWVMCSISLGFKDHAFTKITYRDGIFYHDNKGVYDFGDEPEELFESILKGEIE